MIHFLHSRRRNERAKLQASWDGPETKRTPVQQVLPALSSQQRQNPGGLPKGDMREKECVEMDRFHQEVQVKPGTWKKTCLKHPLRCAGLVRKD